MLDIRFIRENADLVKKAARDKNVNVDIDRLIEVDNKRRELQKKISDIGAKRNELAHGVKSGKPNSEQIETGKKLKEQLSILEKEYASLDEEYILIAEQVPNIPTEDTPVATDESGNTILRKCGDIKKVDFAIKEHWQIAEEQGFLDSERAVNLAGSRFVYLKGDLALLEFALVQFVLNTLTDQETIDKIIREAGINVSAKPFIPVVPPVFTKPEVMQKMGRLEPKEERYHIDTDDLYLIGSAEHALGPMHMDEIIPEKELPIRYVGFSPSFRREAGSYGKDVRGLIRVHQFDKCEMESFATAEQGLGEHELFIAIQEYFVKALGLPYQVVLKCTGDMGTPDARAVDIETWMPGQQKYRETHTADYMTDYQAHRLKTKVKSNKGETEFVHMNDATACAVGRTLAAIIENYQDKNGNILIPEVLQSYMGGRKVIGKN